jgi:hypothetical protein
MIYPEPKEMAASASGVRPANVPVQNTVSPSVSRSKRCPASLTKFFAQFVNFVFAGIGRQLFPILNLC